MTTKRTHWPPAGVMAFDHAEAIAATMESWEASTFRMMALVYAVQLMRGGHRQGTDFIRECDARGWNTNAPLVAYAGWPAEVGGLGGLSGHDD